MCGYLAWIALGGLILNAVFKFSWADSAAALLLLPIVIREGWEVVQGKVVLNAAVEGSEKAMHRVAEGDSQL